MIEMNTGTIHLFCISVKSSNLTLKSSSYLTRMGNHHYHLYFFFFGKKRSVIQGNLRFFGDRFTALTGQEGEGQTPITKVNR